MPRDILDNSESYEKGLFRTMRTFAKEFGVNDLFTTFMMQSQEQEQEQDELECNSTKLENAEETDYEILE